jgi:hypothetical protein
MLKGVDPDGPMSLRAIAEALNGMGIPTVSGKGTWSSNSVRRLKMQGIQNPPSSGVAGATRCGRGL